MGRRCDEQWGLPHGLGVFFDICWDVSWLLGGGKQPRTELGGGMWEVPAPYSTGYRDVCGAHVGYGGPGCSQPHPVF